MTCTVLRSEWIRNNAGYYLLEGTSRLEQMPVWSVNRSLEALRVEEGTSLILVV